MALIVIRAIRYAPAQYRALALRLLCTLASFSVTGIAFGASFEAIPIIQVGAEYESNPRLEVDDENDATGLILDAQLNTEWATERTSLTVNPRARFYLTSNLNYLNDGLLEALVGRLDVLNVSLDAATDETYKKIRVKGQLSKVLKAIERIEMRKRELSIKTPELTYAFVVQKDNVMEMPVFVDFVHRLSGKFITFEHVVGIRVDRFVGLQPHTASQMHLIEDIPDELFCGNPAHFGFTTVTEPEAFQERFWLEFLPFYYRNNPAGTEDPASMIDGTDICMPCLWCAEPTLIAYSKEGCEGKAWKLPADWGDVAKVSAATITGEGAEPIGEVEVTDGSMALTLGKNQTVRITKG